MRPEDLQALQNAVKSEVERDRQRVIQDAESHAQVIRERAQAEAEGERDRVVREAEERATRLKLEELGTARLEAQALKMKQREALLDRVFAEAANRLSNPEHFSDYTAIVEHLIVDAAGHLSGSETLMILADPRAREALDDATLKRLSATVATELELGESLEEGVGVVLQTTDGRLRYDNTLSARLARMRSALRSPVYRILIGEQS